MVDPTKGISSVTPVSGKPSGSSGAKEKQEGRESAPAPPVDSVEISQQALSLQEAERSAAQARQSLEENDVSLGLDPEKLEEPVQAQGG